MSAGQHILVTGGAGFIGSHLCERLLAGGRRVRALDNLDPYYDVAIKRRNLDAVAAAGGRRFELVEGDFRDPRVAAAAVDGIDAVVHLGALAGVRPSIQDPVRYMDVNVSGTQVLLEAVGRRREAIPVVFGSSSSVYGGNEKVPFAETDPVDGPVSPYAASKRAGELLCHTFHHLHGNPVACLRFFTVYGPRQRPEMAIHLFARRMAAGEAVPCFGDGESRRDYTYVSDVVDGVVAALERVRGYRVYNLGGNRTTSLGELVAMLAEVLGVEPLVDRRPDQPGDVPRTWADLSRSAAELGYRPRVELRDGLTRFVEWFRAEQAAGLV